MLSNLKIGDRVRLLAPMINKAYMWNNELKQSVIPTEDVPVGTLGRVTYCSDPGGAVVSWDNGRTLGVLPHDDIEVVNE